MKTLYCNGVSDVQVYNENKKTSKHIGTATMGAVLSAKKEGEVMTFKTSSGQNVGVKIDLWSEFMDIHNTDKNRMNSELKAMPKM